MSNLGASSRYDIMAAKNTDKNKFVTVKLTERISVNVTEFNGMVWFHFKDNRKQKSLSLNKGDMSALFANKKDLIAASKSFMKHKVSDKDASNQAERKQHSKQYRKPNKKRLLKSKYNMSADINESDDEDEDNTDVEREAMFEDDENRDKSMSQSRKNCESDDSDLMDF